MALHCCCVLPLLTVCQWTLSQEAVRLWWRGGVLPGLHLDKWESHGSAFRGSFLEGRSMWTRTSSFIHIFCSYVIIILIKKKSGSFFCEKSLLMAKTWEVVGNSEKFPSSFCLIPSVDFALGVISHITCSSQMVRGVSTP